MLSASAVGDIQRLAIEVLAKSFAVQQFHHQKWMTRRFADVVNRANVWMIQRRRRARLALEAFPRVIRCKRLGQNFNGDVAMQPCVPGTVHLPHPAFADGRKDFVWAELFAYSERHLSGQLKLSGSTRGLPLGDGIAC